MIRFIPILGTSIICSPHEQASSLDVQTMIGKVPGLKAIGNEVVKTMESAPTPDAPEQSVKNEQALKMPTPSLTPRPPSPPF